VLARDKLSSLLRTFLNYGRKSFITLGPACSSSSYVGTCEVVVVVVEVVVVMVILYVSVVVVVIVAAVVVVLSF
jgi:hypothetical protein